MVGIPYVSITVTVDLLDDVRATCTRDHTSSPPRPVRATSATESLTRSVRAPVEGLCNAVSSLKTLTCVSVWRLKLPYLSVARPFGARRAARMMRWQPQSGKKPGASS